MREYRTYLERYGNEEKLPWEMVLVDVPEPDPGKLNFRDDVKKRSLKAFQELGVLNKLIEYLEPTH